MPNNIFCEDYYNINLLTFWKKKILWNTSCININILDSYQDGSGRRIYQTHKKHTNSSQTYLKR